MNAQSGNELYRFHHANIHERRVAAAITRMIPAFMFVLVLTLLIAGVFASTNLLLATTAVLNVSMWLWISTTAGFSIIGAYTAAHEIQEAALKQKHPDVGVDHQVVSMGRADQVESGTSVIGSMKIQEPIHAIVLPNYKEDEQCLTETLMGLSQSQGSSKFIVCLAMEEREGQEAHDKANRLKEQWSSHFAYMLAAFHPADIIEHHLDGTEDPEVPGKASNLKHAVAQVYEEIRQYLTIDTENIVLTVADADVIFHPYYFTRVSQEWLEMKNAPGEQHKWTMYQSPQFANRNYYTCPLPSRVWGYIAGVYESGGCGGLAFGSHHMVFSAYSVPLCLAVKAQLWDGDVLAEDHHAYMKCFMYSAHKAAEVLMQQQENTAAAESGIIPRVRVRGIMLPAKSTSVAAEHYWQSWKDRWDQAYRHTMGVGEVSYSLLSCWDLMCTLPLRCYNMQLLMRLAKLVSRPICSHILPSLQGLALGVFTVFWLIERERIQGCPRQIWLGSTDGTTLLCGLAGAWTLTYPIAIPFVLMIAANYLHLVVGFIQPADKSDKLWNKEDGQIPKTFGYQRLTLVPLLLIDIAICLGPIMAVYGLVAEVLAVKNIAIYGNRFKYVTANKFIEKTGGGKQEDYNTFAASSASSS